jgi:hypothetical protein
MDDDDLGAREWMWVALMAAAAGALAALSLPWP